MVMRTKYHFSKWALPILLVVLLATPGCKDLFTDPLKDKDTGDDISLLLIDLNVVKTKIAVHLVDLATNEPLSDGEVGILFMGSDAANVITMSGQKPDKFLTMNDFLEVGYDPNQEVSQQNPIELTVTAVSQHYVSAPQFVSFTEEGSKDLVIKMIRISSGKAANVGPFGEPYDLYYNGNLSSTEMGYTGDISSMPTGTAWSYINLYRPTAAGSLLANNLQDPILYEDYGVYYLNLLDGSSLVPPAVATRSASIGAGSLVYSSVLRSGMARCETGLRVFISRADNKPGTGQLGYTITFADNSVKTGLLTATFPSEHLIEPIYYPAANPAMTIALEGNSQYDLSGPVTLGSACNAVASFTAYPKSELETYKFIVRYTCPNSLVSVALTIGGQFRKSGSSDSWSAFQFREGICTLMLERGAEYDFRVSINGVYHEYALPTNPADLETYIRDHQNEDYRIRTLTIDTSGSMIVIETDVEFSGEVCDELIGKRD